MEPYYYQVNVKWKEGRQGVMYSPELKTRANENQFIEIATPPQFPKGVAGIWSPEHLFTAAVSSCFMTTFLAVAETFRLKFSDFSCLSVGKLDQEDKGLVITEVLIEPVVTILEEEDRDKALRMLARTEASCFISNSIKGRIVLKPIIRLASSLNRV